MLDKFPLVVDHFRGIRVTDSDDAYTSKNNDVVPFDNAFEMDNFVFLKTGGAKTRDGFALLLSAAGISITGEIVSYWQIKVLNGIPRSNRWLILTWDGTTGRMYDTGVTAPATNPILEIIGMKYAFVINAFNRIYISPWEAWGTPLRTTATTIGGVVANLIFVYNGLYNARFTQLIAPGPGTLAAATGAAGFVTAGLHLIDVAFESDTGFISAFAGFGLAVVQYTAPGSAQINITNIPLGPTPHTAKRHIAMTKVIAGTYDGQGFTTNEPFFVGVINDNTTTILTIDKPDSGLVDSAAYLIGRSPFTQTCVSMSVYNNRMIYNGLRTTGASDPPPDPENNSSILISPPGLPEDVNHFGNDNSKLYIGQEHTGKVLNGAELRGVYYIGKEDSVFAIQDSTDLDPSEWAVNLIDSGLGIYPLGIASVSDNPGSLVLDNLLFAGPSGIHRFTGTFDPVPISIGFWDSYTKAELQFIQLVVDPVRKIIFALFNDPIDPDKFMFCGNYYEGMSADTLRWSRYVLPVASGNWNGKLPWLGLVVTANSSYPTPVVGYKGVSNSLITIETETPNTLKDLSINADLNWSWITGFTASNLGELFNHTGFRLRALLKDNDKNIDISYSALDDDNFLPMEDVTLASNPGKFFTRVFSHIGEKVRIKISGNSKVVVNKMIVFASEYAKDRAR